MLSLNNHFQCNIIIYRQRHVDELTNEFLPHGTAKRGVATSSRLFVHLSVTLSYRDIRWNTCEDNLTVS